MDSEQREQLKEKLEKKEKESWNPDPGEELIGEVLERQEDVPHKYGSCDLLVVDDPEREVNSVVWMSVEELEEKLSNVQVGDDVAIKYEGERDSTSSDHRYHHFSVYIYDEEESERKRQFDADEVDPTVESQPPF